MLKIAALRDRSIFFSNENHCLDWSADAHNTANAFKWIILSPKSSTTSNFIGIIYIYCLNICIKVYQFDWWWWIFFHSLEFRWMEFDIRFGVHFFSHLLRSFISTYFFHVCVCVCVNASMILCLSSSCSMSSDKKIYIKICPNNSVRCISLNHDLFIGKWWKNHRTTITFDR